MRISELGADATRAFIPLTLVLVCLLGISRPLAAQPWDPGHKLVGSFQVDRVIAPLPEGTWVVAANEIWRNEENAPLLHIWLVQIDKDVVRGAIEGWISTQYRRKRYRRNPNCKRTDMHFIQQFAKFVGYRQDCYWVSNWRNPGTKPREADLRAVAFVESQGVRFPSVMIAVGYRFADRGRTMGFRYFFNPELAGFPPAKQTSWDESEWHRDKVATDLNRSFYVQILIDWATEAYPTVKAGFRGNALELPPWPTFAESQGTIDSKHKSVEDRLRELKSLQDKGLISDEEVSEKRKQILSDL